MYKIKNFFIKKLKKILIFIQNKYIIEISTQVLLIFYIQNKIHNFYV